MSRANGLHEPGHAHDDSEVPPAEGSDSELVIDITELHHSSEGAEVERMDVEGCADGTKWLDVVEAAQGCMRSHGGSMEVVWRQHKAGR